MFELSVALKYLIPRWRQLSVSIISLISILVIALVVWLLVVFLSVIHGLENSWTQKLIALTAPARVIPTENYYRSHYYLIDSISADSDYTLKSIGEKLASTLTDPYDPQFDQEIPETWPTPDTDEDGKLKDLVKLAFASIKHIPNIGGLEAKEFEMTIANIRLNLVHDKQQESDDHPLTISQTSYLSSYDPTNPTLPKALLPVNKEEADRLIKKMGRDAQGDWENLLLHARIPQALPHDSTIGEAILLPRAYRDAGAKIGNQGYLFYQTPSVSAVQEQRIPVIVAGFHDPGIFPIGNKVILVNPEITAMIRSAYPQENTGLTNGINVRFPHLDQTESVKQHIKEAFRNAGIDAYWKVETFREYEFTKDILQQIRSEGNLFTLISMVIIIIACSNIVSMLIILVNNKKSEIGILRSMGASPTSIAAIFGLCGVVIGLVGGLLGTAVALLTLRHLQALINLISRIQGFDAFNPVFFGETMPNEVSFQALACVLLATSLVSLIAGIVPAVKACLIRPSAILRSE
ncbi:MAG: FtsX-like permease family protein [Waddliaceae bacterium]